MPPICRYDLEAEACLQVDDAAAQGCLRLAEVGGRDDVGDSGWIEVKVVEEIESIGTDFELCVLAEDRHSGKAEGLRDGGVDVAVAGSG
jgi:predicted methyltransferase MtxX (methanogen marker protein 4)